MSRFPFLLRCLLALALIAYGLPTTASSHAGHGNVADFQLAGTDDLPCHELAPEPAVDVSNCCDGDGPACGCDCLHHASGLVIAGVFTGCVVANPGPGVALAGVAPRSSSAPSLRPPIG